MPRCTTLPSLRCCHARSLCPDEHCPREERCSCDAALLTKQGPGTPVSPALAVRSYLRSSSHRTISRSGPFSGLPVLGQHTHADGCCSGRNQIVVLHLTTSLIDSCGRKQGGSTVAQTFSHSLECTTKCQKDPWSEGGPCSSVTCANHWEGRSSCGRNSCCQLVIKMNLTRVIEIPGCGDCPNRSRRYAPSPQPSPLDG
jgi:hypothetical protein